MFPQRRLGIPSQVPPKKVGEPVRFPMLGNLTEKLPPQTQTQADTRTEIEGDKEGLGEGS